MKEKFVLEQTQLNLRNRLESGDLLVSKSYELIKINITFLTAEFASLVAVISIKNWQFIWPLLALIIVGYWICWLLYPNLRAREFTPLGNLPNILLQQPYYGQELEMIILGEAQNYEERISKAQAANVRISKNLNRAIILTMVSPLIALVAFGAYYLAQTLFHQGAAGA